MKKILLIGTVDETHTKISGQYDRTEIIRDGLNKIGYSVFFVNMINWKRNPLSILSLISIKYFKSDVIIFLASLNGTRILLNLFSFLKVFKKKTIFQIAIGGQSNVRFIRKSSWYRRKVESLSGIFVEVASMVNDYKSINVNNVHYLPNCKKININENVLYNAALKTPYRFCTYSRIAPEKGISEAIKAVEELNELCGENFCKLDIYGTYLKADKEWFDKLKKESTNAITFKGRIERKDSISTLSRYDLMLFPTQHTGEGVPGGMIDCYEAGLPIITCDTSYMSKIVHDGITGFVYDKQAKFGLRNAILKYANEYTKNEKQILRMNCLKEAQIYDTENVIKTLSVYIDKAQCLERKNVESETSPRIVIFGAGSFIGKNLIKELHSDYSLKLLEADLSYMNDIMNAIDDKNIEMQKYVFSPDTDFASMLNPNDIVIHLASSTNPTTSNKNISEEISTNVLSSAKLFDACVRKKIKKIIFVSSGGTVYGKNVRCPIDEDTHTDPINSYGLQKLTIEKMLYLYNIMYGLDYRIARLSNPYGPYQRPNGKLGVITTFLYNALMGREITVYGDGTVIRDFIYIDDAVKAIRTLMENDCQHRIYNIGSGTGTSIKQILTIIQAEVKRNMKIVFGESRRVDVPENYLDVSRYNLEFGGGGEGI